MVLRSVMARLHAQFYKKAINQRVMGLTLICFTYNVAFIRIFNFYQKLVKLDRR